MQRRQQVVVQVSFSLFLLLVPSTVYSDGIVFIVFDTSSERPLLEHEQRTAISYREGIERMIIAIHFEVEGTDSATWILPMPGTPERTKAEVVDTFPAFHGIDPHTRVSEDIGGLMTLGSGMTVFSCAKTSCLDPGKSGFHEIRKFRAFE